MIIERKLVTYNQNVVSGIAFCRPNPDGRESTLGIGTEKRIRQNVACPACEEDPVGQGPPFYRVSLRAFRAQLVHFRLRLADAA